MSRLIYISQLLNAQFNVFYVHDSLRIYTCSCRPREEQSFNPFAEHLPELIAPGIALSPDQMDIIDVLWIIR